jgi:hypothetical protein
MVQSKSIDVSHLKESGLPSVDSDEFSDRKIISQYIDTMFGSLSDSDRKVNLWTRLGWFFWQDIVGLYHDTRYKIRNRRIWRKTLSNLRPWEGFTGLITVMQTHLHDYLDMEEKYDSVSEDREQCISSAKATLEVLERIKEPGDYARRLLAVVEAKYPKYKKLVTTYSNGGTSFSGCFAPQGAGWAGHESGKDPREGYFEFVNGRFELAESPDQAETDRLLSELHQYHIDIDAAYKQAKEENDADFIRLGELLRDNLYTWWE